VTAENPTSPIKIAVDVGFHAFKAALVWDDKIHTELVPAVVGVGETDTGLLQTGLVRQKKQMPDVVIVEDLRHLVGAYVNLYARPIERLDFDRLTFSPELRALLYTTLGKLLSRPGVSVLPDATVDLALIIALPVQVLQGPDAKAVVQALESWILGEHFFFLNDRAFHLRVQALKAMTQPLGSFFDWGMNVNGQWGRSPADLKASVAVLDQGFNTLDLFHLAGGQIVRRYTGGETLGQRRAAKAMQDLLMQKAGRRFSLHEADEFVRQASNGHRAELLVKGEAMDLKPLARQALDIAAGEVRAYLSQTWEDGRTFDYILLTGGGVLAMGERLRSAYPNAIELPEPVTANARGLAKFAQRAGVLDAPKKVA